MIHTAAERQEQHTHTQSERRYLSSLFYNARAVKSPSRFRSNAVTTVRAPRSPTCKKKDKSHYELLLIANHPNESLQHRRITQIMDRVCMDWKVSMLPTRWLNCDLPNQNWPRSDCRLHARYYGKMDGKTLMLWQFIGATQTMFKNNHPYKTENKTHTRSKVNLLVLPAAWKGFYRDTGFITHYPSVACSLLKLKTVTLVKK